MFPLKVIECISDSPDHIYIASGESRWVRRDALAEAYALYKGALDRISDTVGVWVRFAGGRVSGGAVRPWSW